MKKINPRDFETYINNPNIVGILFSSNNCPPCEDLTKSIFAVTNEFPDIEFFKVYRNGLNVEPIANKYRVNYTPRLLFFKNGKEIGRLFSTKTPDQLREYLTEIENTGIILSDPDDVEEISQFYGRIIAAENKDWSSFDEKKEDHESERVLDLAEKLMASEKRWRLLNDKEILEAIGKLT